MKRSLREALAESHVAAIAIASLLLGSMASAFEAIWPYVSAALGFLFTAVAILDIPYFYFSPRFNVAGLIIPLWHLYAAIVSLSAAWLLSRWVYGAGPLSALGRYHSGLTGRKNA